MTRSAEEIKSDILAFTQAAKKDPAILWHIVGKALLAAFQDGGKSGVETKASEVLKNKSAEEINAMAREWPPEVNNALAEWFARDERFRPYFQ